MYQSLIRDWRQRKGTGDFAFGTIQLPPSVPSTTPLPAQMDTGRMQIRLAEAEARSHRFGFTDISEVAVTLDLGGKSSWGFDHPPNKNEMARRLALATAHAAYGLQEPAWTGPVLQTITASDGTLTIRFQDASLALRDVKAANPDGTRNDCVRCCAGQPPFEVTVDANILGKNAEWTRIDLASTTLDGNTVVLHVGENMAPNITGVRYAWSDFVDCVLENSEGLVASPFVQPVNAATMHEKRTIGRETALQATTRQEVEQGFSLPPPPPPMGFNTWNFYHCNADENIVKAIADAVVENKMKDAGYRYINIDDCWQVERLPNGTIQVDPSRFPGGMKALADYVHSKGLLFGLYTARGSRTCMGRPGAFQHEQIDAQTYCEWGLDYLKDDNCGGTVSKALNDSWIKFRSAFDDCTKSTGREIMLSVEYCRTPDGCGEWVANTANLWRTTDDVQATWSSVMANIHAQEPMYTIARPGHYNDPDMLEIGNVGLTPDEQRSQMALWCISSAPLLAGTDLIHASKETLAILTNTEVIAIDQDMGWKNQVQGHILRTSGSFEVWGKRLADGSWAAVLLNLGDAPSHFTLQWSDLGLSESVRASVRDLCAHRSLGNYSGTTPPWCPAMATPLKIKIDD